MLTKRCVLREEGHDDGGRRVDLFLKGVTLLAAPAQLAAKLGEFFGAALLETAGRPGWWRCGRPTR
ncbi:hypothetical protein [Streptomyces acidiscabies]|uniref:hypothetical protein n=1 Tax=Streptomyces acidiscabies TaxID=42234 RepID=UPI000B08D767|nr:hypothetical protein [Streptomyces acidiscabies]